MILSSPSEFREEALEIEIEPRTFVQVEFAQPKFSVRTNSQGERVVFHHNLALDGDLAERLLLQFQRSATANDYWSATAAELARQLQAAIEERDVQS